MAQHDAAQAGDAAQAALRAHDCRITTEDHDDVLVIRVEGHFDWSTVDGFRHLLRDDSTQAAVIIDLTETTSVDSAGTGMLLAGTVWADRRHQQLVVVSTDAPVLEALASTGLPSVVPVVATERDAWTWLRARHMTSEAV